MKHKVKNILVFSVYAMLMAALTGCGGLGKVTYSPVIQQEMTYASALDDLLNAARSGNIFTATGPFTPVRNITNIIVNENGVVRWELAPELEWKDNVGPAPGPGPSQAFDMSLFTPGLNFDVHKWGPSWAIQLPDFMIAGNSQSLKRAANDLYFIRQNLDNLAEKQKNELALFEPIAARYRELNIKPTISEEQRKYIVQANSMTEQKLYRQAQAKYLKAIEIDPTSYPAAYSNMALLAAQENHFHTAIFRMKQYLMLVPDAKDARSAQDKIYEWEDMVKQN